MNRIIFLVNLALFIVLVNTNFNDEATPVASKTTQETVPWETKQSPGQLFAGIQVNSLPHPFNLDGSLPYQIWVDGERLPLRGEMVDKIIELLDLGEFKQPKDTAEIHNGAGWMFPLPVK